MSQDDGFGPVARGGGHSPRGVDVNPRPRPRSKPDAYRDHGPADPSEGFGPPSQGHHRRLRAPRFARVLKILAILLLVLVLAAAGTGLAAALSANNKIERINVRGLENPGGGRRNILIIGSDDREGMTRRQRRRLNTGNFAGNRTDTILLLSIQGSRGAMLSFPRDLYVQRCDGTEGRINGAYAIDGATCLVRTVSGVSGIPVSHYLEVDFLGFHDIVQAVGGVHMCLEERIDDPEARIHLRKGCQRLNGKKALDYVRVRKVDNDFGRIERQQRFMKELAKEIAQPSTALNPSRLFSTGNSVGRALTADRGLGLFDLAALARAGSAMGTTSFPSYAVPSDPAWIGGASVLAIDRDEATPLFRSFRDGSVLDRVGADVTPEEVSLEVRNGAGTPGLAQAVGDALTQQGFDVTAIGNARSVNRTVVRFTEGHRDHARLVSRQLPTEAALRQVNSGPPVVLILGADAAEAAAGS